MKDRFNVQYLWSEYMSELAAKLELFLKNIKREELVGISNIIRDDNESVVYKVFVYYYDKLDKSGKE